MGIKCPQCSVQAAYVSAITATGEPAKKNSDIIAKKLSCGHTIGNKDYMQYRQELKVIEADEAEQIRIIREKTHKARMAIWQKISNPASEE